MKCPNCDNELSNNALFCDNCGQEVPAQSKNADKIFCANCGAELESGTEFCGNCGTPIGDLDAKDVNYTFCGNCGAKMPDNLQVCTNCGNKLHIDSNHNLGKQSGKKYVIAIIVLAVIILAMAAAIFGYFFYINSSDADGNEENIQVTATPTASEVPTSSPKSTDNPGEDSNTQISTNVGKLETYYVVNCNTNISLRETPSTSAKVIREIPLGSPVSYVEASQNGFAKIIYDGTTGYALQAYLSNNAEDIRKPNNNPPPINNTDDKNINSSSNSVASDPSYKTYTDSEYNFTCAYPSHFHVYNDADKFVRYSLKSPDNSITLKICGTTNTGLSVNNVMDNFKSSYPGAVEYESSGDTWCAICTEKNNQRHYGYFSVKDGMIRGFEMHFGQENYSICDKYVNDIYDSLKFY